MGAPTRLTQPIKNTLPLSSIFICKSVRRSAQLCRSMGALPIDQYPALMADWSGASRGEPGAHGGFASDEASLRAELLALLLEPLGVDVMAGLDSLERLTRDVDAVAQTFEVAS